MKESRDAFKKSFNALANTVEIITGFTAKVATQVS